MVSIDAHRALAIVAAVGLSLSLAGVTSCAPASTGAPLRSPTRDYPPPPPTSSDGEVVGADGQAPPDKLAEGATTDGPAPGWEVDEDGVRYDPERRGPGMEPPPGESSKPAR